MMIKKTMPGLQAEQEARDLQRERISEKGDVFMDMSDPCYGHPGDCPTCQTPCGRYARIDPMDLRRCMPLPHVQPLASVTKIDTTRLEQERATATIERLKHDLDTVITEREDLRQRNQALHQLNLQLAEENRNLRSMLTAGESAANMQAQIKNQSTTIGSLITENETLKLKVMTKTNEAKALRKGLEEVKAENLKLIMENTNLKRRVVVKDDSTPDNFWVHQEIIDTMKKNEAEDIAFSVCVSKEGEPFIDARVRYCGHMTRKGICLRLETFREFAKKVQSVGGKVRI